MFVKLKLIYTVIKDNQWEYLQNLPPDILHSNAYKKTVSVLASKQGNVFRFQ